MKRNYHRIKKERNMKFERRKEANGICVRFAILLLRRSLTSSHRITSAHIAFRHTVEISSEHVHSQFLHSSCFATILQ